MARSGAQLGVNIYAEVAQMRAATRELQSSVADMGASLDKLAGAADGPARGMAEAQRTAQMMGRGFLTAGAAILSGFAMSTKAAMDWELSFADVVKTVNASDAELAKLEGQLRQIARTTPVAHDEIARIASIAGQLGIKSADIAKFTQVTANMAVATTLTADEAAMSLARLSNIMGLDVATNVEAMADTIVHLGNNMATTETEIVAMSMQFASAGAVAGLSAQEVIGLSASLSAVGVNAEAGGTALGRFALEMDGAVRQGGDKLEKFADVAGVTAEEFATAYREKPTEAMLMFVRGLDRINKSGGSVTEVLKSLGLNEIRVRRALLSMANNTGLVSDALGLANTGWNDSNALIEEVTKRYDTANMSIDTAKNTIRDIMIELGSRFVPVVTSAAQKVQTWGRAWSSWAEQSGGVINAVGGTVGVISAVGGAAVLAGPKINDFKNSMSNLAANGAGPVMRNLGRLGTFLMGPWGLAVAGAITVGALWMDQKAEQADLEMRWAEALRESEGAITEQSSEMALGIMVQEGMIDSYKRTGASLDELVDHLNSGTAGTQLFHDEMNEVMVLMADQSPVTNITSAIRGVVPVTDEMAAALRRAGIEVSANNTITQEQALALNSLYSEYIGNAEAIEGAADNQELYNEVVGAGKDEVINIADAISEHSEVLEMNNKLVEEARDLSVSLRIANGDVHAAQRELTESIAENGQVWDETTEAGLANWNMLQGWTDSVNSRAEAVKEATGSDEEANAVIQEGLVWLEENRNALGLSEEQYQEVVGALSDYTIAQGAAGESIMGVNSLMDLYNQNTGKSAQETAGLRERMTELVSEAQKLHTEMQQSGEVSGETADQYDRLNGELVEMLREMGLSEEAARSLAQSLIMGEEIEATRGQFEGLGGEAAETRRQFSTFTGALGSLADRMGLNVEVYQEQGVELDALIGEAHELTDAFNRGEVGAGEYGAEMNDLRERFISAAEAAGISREHAEELWREHSAARKPVDDLSEALRGLERRGELTDSAIDGLRQALKDNGTEVDSSNGKIRDLIDTTGNLFEEAERLHGEYRAGTRNGASLRREMGRLEEQFVSQAREMGFTEDQARALWAELKEGDGLKIKTTIDIEGNYDWDMGGAWEGGGASNGHGFGGLATGGAVRGPGDGTSDSIPKWLSNGEHVLTAREVQLMGGQQAVYDFRNRLRSGRLKNLYEQPISDTQMLQTIQSMWANAEGHKDGGAISSRSHKFLPKKTFKYKGNTGGKQVAKISADTFTDWDKEINAAHEHAVQEFMNSMMFFGGGGGTTVFTSFWDPQTASGKPMNSKTIASSYIPLGSKIRVNIGGKTAIGIVEDLGPAKFVYDRHPGKAVLDLNEIMMQQLTGRRSNVVEGSHELLTVGTGRTLYGRDLAGYDTKRYGAPAGGGMAAIPAGNMAGRVRAAQIWARSQHGKPYQWGGGGNPSWDCSGFMAGIQKVLMGQRPVGRLWSTHAFVGAGPPGWQRNLPSAFTVGVTNAGVGHMAGTLGGMNVESAGGGKGVVVGPRALGTMRGPWQSRWGFQPLRAGSSGIGAPGGRVGSTSQSGGSGRRSSSGGRPNTNVLDTGGIWGTGEFGINLGKPERVLSPRQTTAFEKLVEILDRGDVLGPRTIINQHGINGFSDIQEIRRAQDAHERARAVGRRT